MRWRKQPRSEVTLPNTLRPGKQSHSRRPACATCCYTARLARPSSDFHSLISAPALARFHRGLTLFKMGALGSKLLFAALALAGGSLTAFATETTRSRSCAVEEHAPGDADSGRILANLATDNKTLSLVGRPESPNRVMQSSPAAAPTPALRTSLHTSRPDAHEGGPARGLVEPWQARTASSSRARVATRQFSTREVIDPWASTAR